jgi:hypothetical protein
MQVRVKEQQEECIGWHGLTEEQYQTALDEYEKNLFEDEE